MALSKLMFSQCNPNVPSFNVNLTGNPDSVWTSPGIIRDDYCCGASGNDRCVSFTIILDPNAVGISFDIIAGAVPGGALFYQVNCGPPTPLGEPICLNGVGPHNITFCKPGNNANVYQISSIPGPVGGGDITINDGCIGSLLAEGFDSTTVTWTSISPGAPGTYDSFLSCTSNCLSPTVSSTGTPPSFVDYMICGEPASQCNNVVVCDTVRVTFNPTLGVTIVPQNPTVCFGQTNTTITANGSGGTPPYSYLWNNTTPTQSITVGVGTYTVMLSDSSGCPPVFETITVTEFTNPITANAGPDDTICTQNPIIALNGIVTGASGGIWSGGNGSYSPNDSTITGSSYSPTAAEIANGFVDLILTTTGNGTCPSDHDTVRYYFMGFIGVPNITSTNISCFGLTDGSATVNISNGIPPYSISWSTVPLQTGNTATNLSSGTLYVTIENGIGCVIQDSVVITQPTPLVSSINFTNTSCNNGNDGSASVIPLGGTPPYTFAWTPGGQTNDTILNLSAGTYIVTITDSNGCTITDSVNISEPPPLTSNITPTHVSCFGGVDGTANANISGGTPIYSYSWSPYGGNGPTASGLSSGTYYLTVTDTNHCVLIDSIIITEPSAPLSVSLSATDVNCYGSSDGTASTLVSGGTIPYSYLWSPGGQTTPTISGQPTGTYTVTITDTNGCVTADVITISTPTPLLISMNSNNVSCNGGNDGTGLVMVSGGTAPYTYLWNPGGLTSSSISGIPAGTYTVTVTDSNGCQEIDSVEITEPSNPLSADLTANHVSCSGGNDGSVFSSVGGGTPPYSYFWLPNGQTTSNINNLYAGTYTLNLVDSNGCTFADSIVVTEPLPIYLSGGSNNSSCGLANGLAYISVDSGGTSPFTYQWLPIGGTNDTANFLLAGSYIAQVTDSNGCVATLNINVNDNTAPVASVLGTNVSCFNGSDGTASVSLIGGSAPFSYSWSPSGDTIASIGGLSAGTHYVTVTDANGCQASANITLTEPDSILSTVTTLNASCFGGNDGGASVSTTGGTPNYNYQWLPGSTSGTSISGLTAGNYQLVTTDNNGCIDTVSYIINEPTLLSITVDTVTNVSCFGGSNGAATISVTGGTPNYSYSWSPSGGNSPSPTGLTAGAYTVTIQDANGCPSSTVINIIEPSQPLTVSVSSQPTSCFGGNDGSASIIASGGTPGYTYNWSPTGGTNSSATGLNAGIYSVLVSDSNGCQTTSFTIVSQPSVVSGNLIVENPHCGQANGIITAQISGGTPGYSYLWSNSDTSSTVNNLAPGLYNVNISDSLGCGLTLSTNLTNIPGPTVTIPSQTNVSCNGGNDGTATGNITGGTSPYYLNWTPYGGNGNTASNLIAGTYTLSVTDSLGCNASDSVIITDPPQVNLFVNTINHVSCNGGNDGFASVNVLGGTGPYNYIWSPNVSSTNTASNLIAGNYTVTILDANGCSGSLSVTITEPFPLSVLFSSVTNPTCNTSTNGSAQAVASGGTIPYSYSWSNGQTGGTATNLNGGVYSITITDWNGCSVSDSVTIVQPQLVITTIGIDDTICLGQSGTVSAIATGGTSPYTFAWQPNGVVNNGTLVDNPTNSTDYIVMAIDQNGCPGNLDTASIVVYQLNSSSIQANAYSPICPGQVTVIYADTFGTTGPLTYQWSNGLGTTAGPYIVTPSQPTTYYVTATNSCGVSITDSVTVDFAPPPTLTMFSNIDSSCVPGLFSFTDNSFANNPPDSISSWLWNFGDGSTSQDQNPQHVYTQPGTYNVTLTVTTNSGCTNNNASAPYVISVFPNPIAAFSLNSTSFFLPSEQMITTNSSVGATTYFWDFGDGGNSTAVEPTYLYSSIGNYIVTLIATNQYGCSDTAFIEIITDADLVVPNAFTPNNGGSSGGYYDINSLDNDIFFPYASGIVDYKFEIFNRWGEIVFATNNFKQGWDGYYKGKLAQKGVYIWKIYAKFNNNKVINRTGDVTLLR